MSLTHHLVDSPYDDFDWSALDSHEFLEDAVREEIIAPLLRVMGYKATGLNRIIRSKRLTHPFVALGTTQHRISLVPDYLLIADDRPAWILDAKSPKESVLDASHEAQAYSYVCNREVRADWYAVCNGREFAAFHVGDMSPQPRLHFKVEALKENWDSLWGALAPEAVHQHPRANSKDFGIHLLKLGIPREMSLYFVDVLVPLLARVGDSLFSFTVSVSMEEQQYAATFDFDDKRLDELLAVLPSHIASKAGACFATVPSVIKIQGEPPCVTIKAKLGENILENDQEHYLPLEVIKFPP